MSLSFDVQNILVLLAGFTGIIYGLIIYSGNKKNQTNLNCLHLQLFGHN